MSSSMSAPVVLMAVLEQTAISLASFLDRDKPLVKIVSDSSLRAGWFVCRCQSNFEGFITNFKRSHCHVTLRGYKRQSLCVYFKWKSFLLWCMIKRFDVWSIRCLEKTQRRTFVAIMPSFFFPQWVFTVLNDTRPVRSGGQEHHEVRHPLQAPQGPYTFFTCLALNICIVQ